MLEKNIIKELVEKYNLLAKTDLFKEILLRFLNNEIKENEIVHNFRKNLDLDFTTALELANEILFLDKKTKEEILGELKKNLTGRIDLDVTVREIIGSLGLGLNEVLSNRLKNNFIFWLKGVRDANELKDSLMKSEKIGGLSLSSEQADKLILNFTAKRSEWQKLGVDLSALLGEVEKTEPAKIEAKTDIGPKPEVSLGLPKEIKEEEIDVRARALKIQRGPEKPTGPDITIDQLLEEKGIAYQDLAKKEEIKRQLGDRERIVPKEESPLVQEIEKKEEFLESKEEIPPPARPEPEAWPEPRQAVQSEPVQPQTRFEVKQPMINKSLSVTRPKVEDVKFSAQLYGPIDELAALKIEDFRRLSKNPDEAARKILGKIQILEEESMVKRNEGVQALRRSPLYKAYAQIMNTAIKQGQSFNQIIEANPVITLAEFKAIMDLNKSLKF